MKKNFILWGLVIVLLLASLPGVFNRWQVETQNNQYEQVIPYHEIVHLTKDSPLKIDEILERLKTAGLNTVSMNPVTIEDWKKERILSVYTPEELSELLRFLNVDIKIDTEIDGYYVTVPEEATQAKMIREYLKPKELQINKQALYFIRESKSGTSVLKTSMGYDKEAIKQVTDKGLKYLVRIENADKVLNRRTVDEIVAMKNPNVSNILFSGEEVIGYPDLEFTKKATKTLVNAGYNFYSIEFTDQRGLQMMARETNYEMIRLHSLDLDSGTLEVNVDRAVRAVKERNIRSIFVHVPTGDKPIERLDDTTDFLKAVHKEMPNQYQAGTPTPFKQIDIPIWVKIAILAAGVIFTYLAIQVIRWRPLRIIFVAVMALLALGYLATDRLLLIQAFALAISVLSPIYAVVATMKATTKLSIIFIQYMKAIGITFTGILLVLGILNGNAFITGFEVFRGVKLVYILPILFVTVFILWMNKLISTDRTLIIRYLRASVKYSHLILIGLIGAIGFYYITRTGNAGSVSDLELVIRQKLESFLYVRPRTKEFLIGFPLYILALYVMGLSAFWEKWGKFILIPGMIGFLSMMNTFTHLHIPLNISLLRTAYSVVLGLIFGILFIYIFKICYRFVVKLIAKAARWS